MTRLLPLLIECALGSIFTLLVGAAAAQEPNRATLLQREAAELSKPRPDMDRLYETRILLLRDALKRRDDAESTQISNRIQSMCNADAEVALICVTDIANEVYGSGAKAQALQFYRLVLDGTARVKGAQSIEYARVQVRMATILRELARLEEARATFVPALNILTEKLGAEKAETARHQLEYSRVLEALGESAQAREHSTRAMQTLDRVLPPDDPLRTIILWQMSERGEPAARRSAAERAVAITKRVAGANSREYARALRDLGSTYEQLREPKLAEGSYRESISLIRRVAGENHPDGLDTELFLASLLDADNRATEALAVLTTLIPRFEAHYGRTNSVTVPALALKALIELSSKDFAAAERTYRTAIARMRIETHLDTWMYMHAGLARSLEALGRPEEALTFRREVSAALDLQFARSRGLSEDDRIDMLREYQRLYQEEFRQLVTLEKAQPGKGFAARALASLSLDQSRLFTESVLQSAVRKLAGDPAFARQLSARDVAQKELDQALRGASGAVGEDRSAAISAVTARRAALDTQDQQLRNSFPDYMELVRPEPVQLPAVQALLGADEAVLVYGVLRDELVIFALTRERLVQQSSPMGVAAIGDLIAKVRAAVQLPPQVLPSDLMKLDPQDLHTLYRALVQPVQSAIAEKKRWTIIGTGAVYTLPFEMLLRRFDATDKQQFDTQARASQRSGAPLLLAQYGGLAYLGSEVDLSYQASLRAMVSRRRASERATPVPTLQFAAIADPTFSQNGAMPPSAQTALRGLVQARGVRTRQGAAELDPLPDSALEAGEVAKLFGASSRVLLGTQAQEYRVKSGDLADARYVLFATHGLLGGELAKINAQRQSAARAEAALALSFLGDLRGEDGLLTASEIVSSVRLNAELVVLSACNSAGSTSASGEGFVGLTRSLQFAGAKDLVVTHWPVETVTARLMVVSLFRGIRSGLAPGAALRAAARDVRAMPWTFADQPASRAHPAFWAPFVVIGQ